MKLCRLLDVAKTMGLRPWEPKDTNTGGALTKSPEQLQVRMDEEHAIVSGGELQRGAG
jgi:hypothetical protein